MIMSEKMFVIVGAFLCGYCISYCSFEIFKYKNLKEEIHELFKAIIENMAHSVDFLTKKLEETKIADDIFSGEDLPYEQNFLTAIIEKFGKEFKHCEVSFYLSKTSMTICCETLTVTKAIAKNLIKIGEQLIEEHFFQANGLRQLGWCSNYVLDRRSLTYCKEQEDIRRTEVIKFYWFNHSPNGFDKQTVLTEVNICNYMHCHFFFKLTN